MTWQPVPDAPGVICVRRGETTIAAIISTSDDEHRLFLKSSDRGDLRAGAWFNGTLAEAKADAEATMRDLGWRDE